MASVGTKRANHDLHPRLEDDSENMASDELALRVAWYYYKDELTQNEIANRVGISRATIGRILDRARRSGLVTVAVNDKGLDVFPIGRELREAYDLVEVLVVPDHEESSPADGRVRLGRATAQYLSAHLTRVKSLAIGFGESVSESLAALTVTPPHPIRVVAMTGGVDSYLQTMMASGVTIDPSVVHLSLIPTPLVVSNSTLASSLRDEPVIARLFAEAAAADLALVGIGTPRDDSTMVQLGYMTPSEAARIRAAGAVGDILGTFFGADGVPIHDELQTRRIGLPIAQLRGIPIVIGVAGHLTKVSAIRGALRGRHVNVLVTNEFTARALLASS